MKTIVLAGALLTLSLTSCTMTGPGSDSSGSSRMSRSDSMSHSDSMSSLNGMSHSDSMSRSDSMSHSDGYARADPANYHYERFGDPNNMPFNGDYSATW
jgi:hypothetical protein